eukprot:m.5886 g.5886  ORF g.5886 m.5886 type:complete len:97 (+) comp14368_c0_seq1:131-421(+)
MDLESIIDQEVMEEYVAQGLTHKGISEVLKQQFPGYGGLSERNVRRYCDRYDIHWNTPVSTAELDQAVGDAVERPNLRPKNNEGLSGRSLRSERNR